MTTLVLVRHAQSAWNAERRWQGWADPPLSPAGEAQARAGAEATEVRSAGRLYSSDLVRARRTAELMGGAAGIAAVVVDAGWREYDAGLWTGMSRDQIEERWPAELAAWDAGELDRTPGGESPVAFIDRLWGALGHAAGAADVAAGASAVVVSHGRAVHALATALGADGRHIDHLEGWELEVAGGGAAPVLLRPVSLLADRVLEG